MRHWCQGMKCDDFNEKCPNRFMYFKMQPPVGAIEDIQEVQSCWRRSLGMGFENMWLHSVAVLFSAFCEYLDI